MRIDVWEQEGGIAWLALDFGGFQAGLFEDGKGVHQVSL
jgi:hypothetical protein